MVRYTTTARRPLPLRLILFVMFFVFPFEFFLFRLLEEMIVVLFVPCVLYTWAWSFVVFDI